MRNVCEKTLIMPSVACSALARPSSACLHDQNVSPKPSPVAACSSASYSAWMASSSFLPMSSSSTSVSSSEGPAAFISLASYSILTPNTTNCQANSNNE
ncbi:unnamed protein product [Phytophthora lilii]|uniref:Unnamed protein product n=1 Tax=Phytophthora lilii TaxID=2077276 RepID=A0A9W6WP99_9STRA|nr:unnamed protein product [Phytophthora lilii]